MVVNTMMKSMKEKEVMERKQKEKDKRKARWTKGGKNTKVKKYTNKIPSLAMVLGI